MILQPRKFKYKNRQKFRKVRIFSESKRTYGPLTIRLQQTFQISAKKIFRLKLFLKKATKRSDWTKRRMSISLFPHIPLTKKPKGMRMGKGKGKLSTWLTIVPAGKNLVSFKNLRWGRFVYFYKQLQFKFPVKLYTCTLRLKHLKITGAARTNPRHVSFW